MTHELFLAAALFALVSSVSPGLTNTMALGLVASLYPLVFN
jgi:hypothetical protein